jgi:hypothetical protein
MLAMGARSLRTQSRTSCSLSLGLPNLHALADVGSGKANGALPGSFAVSTRDCGPERNGEDHDSSLDLLRAAP